MNGLLRACLGIQKELMRPLKMIQREEALKSHRGSRLLSEADLIQAIQELLTWRLSTKLCGERVLGDPATVKLFLRNHFLGLEHESFVVLFLDSRNHLIEAEELFRGTLTRVMVYPREVIKRTLHWNACSVILSHNHPGGEAVPSDMDRWLTRRLKDALQHIEVNVLDHIIVAGSQTASAAEQGWL
jgi:DNA repair protein RadC